MRYTELAGWSNHLPGIAEKLPCEAVLRTSCNTSRLDGQSAAVP